MPRSIILISAEAEWRAVQAVYPDAVYSRSPFGEYFSSNSTGWECIYFQGGWGKISAAASAQYVIDHFKPDLLVNLGTCGGFSGEIQRGEIVLVEKTVVYDIFEQMGDTDAPIAHYTTEIDLDWLKGSDPHSVRRTLLVSGDRDLLQEELPKLKERFQAVAGDWESGAIAWVAQRNQTPLLILRGVTDLVGEQGSAAYGDLNYFEKAALEIMQNLLKTLPGWLAKFKRY